MSEGDISESSDEYECDEQEEQRTKEDLEAQVLVSDSSPERADTDFQYQEIILDENGSIA